MNQRNSKDRVSVTEAARELGISPQSLRVMLQRGKLPEVGEALESPTGGKRMMYLIYRDNLDRFMGRSTEASISVNALADALNSLTEKSTVNYKDKIAAIYAEEAETA